MLKSSVIKEMHSKIKTLGNHFLSIILLKFKNVYQIFLTL